ncbi:phage antirepressor KilAC domain-containing protein [Sutcliffiella sp. FSL R7-0096]|uniref:phage antirepressor n=1 Tax=Sutcliffiella sp. FSL R7-0096 TaxID=2921670 RepID=UPI00315A86E1
MKLIVTRWKIDVEGEPIMNGLKIFNNGMFEVAVTLENGEVLFELEQLVKNLGFERVEYKNGKEYKSIRWERVEKYLKEVGFAQVWAKDSLIPESIAYLLSFKGESKDAVKFQKWLATEVIPVIRKHGGYLTPEKVEEALLNPDTLIKLATNLKEEREKRKAAELLIAEKNNTIATQLKNLKEQRPKVIFADAVGASKTSILVGELAKLLKQNGIETGQKRLFHWLREKGYLIKRKGTDFNMPTQRSMELELFEIKETSITHNDGHISISKTPKVTGKGQLYFINKFLLENKMLEVN